NLPIALFTVYLSQASYQVTQLPEDCGFPSAGAYAFSVNLTEFSGVSPGGMANLNQSTGVVGFLGHDITWTNLTWLSDDGHYGLRFVPEQSGTPVSFSGFGTYRYTFWLLYET
ncbi:MAG TPA: hypothetical protein VGS23_07220, partial [Thermoplasmata archaeon]|nr:hypothetical protein [Thermoplasmata archaeon]